MSERLKMTVEMQVTPAQALALKAMFNHWNNLAEIGSSRYVGFSVDGDGNFKPKCRVTVVGNLPELTAEMEEKAGVMVGDETLCFDPNAVETILLNRE